VDCDAFLVLFFLDLSTRRVEIAGIAPVANAVWMSQIARNLTDAVDGILTGRRYLIHDRDPLFTSEFLNLLAKVGVESVKLPPRLACAGSFSLVRSAKLSALHSLGHSPLAMIRGG
jgi:putative transposase